MSGPEDNVPPHVSVVVPTWNEVSWICQLLPSLVADKRVAEVIVADHSSSDGTAEAAAKLGARVVQGGRPACGRNAGAREATTQFILFADADTVVPPRAIERLERHFRQDDIVAAHCVLRPVTHNVYVRIVYALMDFYFWVLCRLKRPQGVGSLLVVRAATFARIGGFDETLSVGEDADLLRRLGREGRVIYDRHVVVGVSARRFRLENPILFSFKVALWAALRLAGSRRALVQYRWEQYPREIIDQDRSLMKELATAWGCG